MPVNAEKAKCYRPMDRRTDRAGCRVARPRLKTYHYMTTETNHIVRDDVVNKEETVWVEEMLNLS